MANDFDSITRSLGRTEILTPPAPPSIPPAVARLAQDSPQLIDLFVTRAREAKMVVIPSSIASLASDLLAEVTRRSCKSVTFTRCDPLEQARLPDALAAAGIRASAWSESTLDAVYDVDAGITDIYRAVAETGSIVVRESPEHGRAVSLVPPIHFAIVRRSQVVPDLIDLMADVGRDGSAAGIVIITGPSKTADIEMNLVTGVHGPGEVVLFLID